LITSTTTFGKRANIWTIQMMRADFCRKAIGSWNQAASSALRYRTPKWPLLDYAGLANRAFSRYAYDFETLRLTIESAGFIEVKRDFDPTLDTEARRVGTLYAEARKP
jgi:hypothetical protein